MKRYDPNLWLVHVSAPLVYKDAMIFPFDPMTGQQAAIDLAIKICQRVAPFKGTAKYKIYHQGVLRALGEAGPR